MSQKLELLAPAGNFHTLKAVLAAGADAVYLGGSQFSARAYAGNFNQEEVLSAIDYGHIHNKKIILAVNTLLKGREIEEQLYEYLLPFYEQGLSAVIVQDFGVMQFIRRNFKDLPVHASTQMTVTGVSGAKLLKKAGASRIVMARELSLQEIQKIHQEVSIEIEAFAHGALCYSYSGQCLFSSLLGGRSGNRGRCAQPCRLSYEAYDSQFKKISKSQKQYPLSPKDLCTIELIPQLSESGVFSFKIEGRMKQAEYAAGVVSVYRRCIDRYLNGGKEAYYVKKEEMEYLLNLGNRSGFTNGCYQQWNGADMIAFDNSSHEKSKAESAPLQEELKQKISGVLTVKQNRPMECAVWRQDRKCTVFGEIPKEAVNQPVTEESLRARFEKTGTTPFVFESLKIYLDDGLFLPASQINELRRQALDGLIKQCVSPFRRKASGYKKQKERQSGVKEGKNSLVTASAETKEQLAVLLESPSTQLIYIDSAAFSRDETVDGVNQAVNAAKKTGKRVYYILPAIFREKTAEFYRSIFAKLNPDGFLAKSYDSLGFLLEQGEKPEKIRLDYSLPAWSNESRQAFAAFGIGGDAVPLELNQKELRHRDNAGSELQIYGYLPLMTSVHCVSKNVLGCRHMPSLTYLKDRYAKFFPVKNHCNECYNVLYNSVPLCLFSVMDKLQDLGIDAFRLSFTVESGKETAEILEMFAKRLPFDMSHATYGHYKRGVE